MQHDPKNSSNGGFHKLLFTSAKSSKFEEKQKSKSSKIMESDRKRRNSSELGDSEASELLQLQWSNHSTAFGTALNILRSDDTFCDVTLITSEGEHFPAHKVIISACSTHLRAMLKPLPRWQHPVLIMPKDVPMDDLRDIITFMYSGEVHVERGRLESFLYSAELLKVHGLCDQVNSQKTTTTDQNKPATKKVKKSNVTTTISPAFPLRPSSRNSPKAGPSIPKVKSPSNVPTASTVAVKLEEPNYSDEENHPEHLVIPSDPNSIRVTKQEALFDDNFCSGTRNTTEDDSIAADSPIDSGKKQRFVNG